MAVRLITLPLPLSLSRHPTISVSGTAVLEPKLEAPFFYAPYMDLFGSRRLGYGYREARMHRAPLTLVFQARSGGSPGVHGVCT